ncbi:MAG: DinB family protein [Gemmataceae bacterium]|jgi:uncharacterized damage-inducible protein DinB|nr:DinB family protein [Gemmataceae bacterium]
MSHPLISTYLAGVQQLKDAVKGLTREQLQARPIAGKWSTLEVVAHIADFEPVYADRFQRVAALKKPLLLAADENEFVAHLDYQSRDIEQELQFIEVIRTRMAALLSRLPAEAFTRQGVHNERGLVTLEQLLQSAVNHIPHHIKFIEEKRKALS